MSDFHVTSRQTLLTSKVFSVERRIIDVGPDHFERDVAIHPGAVAMVAVDDRDRVGLIHQYRATFDELMWEIPAGTIEHGDEPLATAQRELVEELGCVAADWHLIGVSLNSPGWTNQQMHIYYATSLTLNERAPDGPEESAATIHWLTREEVRSLIKELPYFDATTRQGLSYFLEQPVGR